MPFADLLRVQMNRPPRYSPGLASRLSGVPKATIVNWLEGRVARPRRWQNIVRVADAIRLGREETEELLAAAGHPSLAELARRADQGDRILLASWVYSETSDLPASAPLPVVATPLLGRTAERATVSDLVCDAKVRIVTLTGIAGVGKTRLAIEVAGMVADRFRDGVAFVALAPITEAEFVPEFIAQALGLIEGSRGMAQSLAARHQLVVLDNFEHLVPALPTIAELVASGPDLTFLITSRVVLHLYGEHQFEVHPLPFPDDADTNLKSVAANPAIALFTERARAVNQSFQLDSSNIETVAEICRRLDGLPLAIELAAARTSVLGPQQLLTRLAGRLGLLTWGARDMPARHQSLQATFDWSLAQLADPARQLFAKLSVFMSGCRLEGAEAVGEPLGSDDVLDALMTLVDHSLLHTSAVGTQERYVMLETVRLYAASLLTDEQSYDSHERGLRYVVEVARKVEREARGPRQGEWLDRADEELDNIRALLRWSLDHDHATSAATIASSLLPFWLRRRPLPEGQRWLDLALSDAQRLTPEVLAATLYAAGRIARHGGDIAMAEQRLRESLSVFKRLGDDAGRARALGSLGVVAYDRGDLDVSADLHHQSLEIHRNRDDGVGMAVALTNLGEIARRRRQFHDAVALQVDSASLFAVGGDGIGEAAALTNLAASQLELGALEDARTALVAAAALWQQVGDRSDLAECLELFTALAAQRKQPARAVRLAAAAAAMRHAARTTPSPPEAERHQVILDTLRQAMDENRFTNVWRDGWTMNPDDAVSFALERGVKDPASASPNVTASPRTRAPND